MAPPSPRRSSRARGTHSQSQQSSTSSSVSSRADRNARFTNKPPSSKSTPSDSIFSEPPDDFEDVRATRRRNRGHEDTRDKPLHLDTIEMVHPDDEIQEDDEAVRCICGFDDYPGPPPLDGDAKHGRDDSEVDVYAVLELTDEVSGFFVQCDICKVWQHGACVGIMTEESSPDEYFCEQCRKDFHKIHVASNGQRYSTYLPIHRQSRNTSRAASLTKDGASRNRKLSPGASAKAASKRRSTLNSREAGYDDDELLRRVIEASKEDVLPETAEGRSQRPKRGRSDSEENQSAVKRQRTGSRSVSPTGDKNETIKDDESEDDDETDNRNGSSKKSRPARTHKEKSEREERERQRQEAANKRKVRADRRRAEDSDPSEEVPLAVARIAASIKVADTPATVEPPAASVPTPDTPPASSVMANSTHKKTASRNQKKSKGRNQYTAEDNEVSPARSMSRDIQKNEESTNGGSSRPTPAEPSSRSHNKSKAGNASKLSMLDMKRRVGAFLEFISRTQVELAGESMDSPKSSDQGSPPNEASNGGVPKIQLNGGGSVASGAESGAAFSPTEGRDFKEMNCGEMMDVLTRDLLRWQNQYSS